MIDFILTHADEFIELALSLIGLASIVIKLAPELDKDHKLKPVLQFIGNYIALNRTTATDLAIKLKRR